MYSFVELEDPPAIRKSGSWIILLKRIFPTLPVTPEIKIFNMDLVYLLSKKDLTLSNHSELKGVC